MKNYLPFLLTGLLSTGAATAQSPITLTSTNVPAVPTTTVLVMPDPANMVMPTRGANQSWSYPQLDIINSGNFEYLPGNNPQFPGNSIYAPGQHADLVTGYGYDYDLYLQGNTTQFARTGRDIPKQDYSAAPVTGNPQDSIHIPAQADVYNTPVPVQVYPMTMGSTWQTDFQSTVHTTISIQAFGFNNTPMDKRTYAAVTDSVIGWGTLQLGTLAGQTSTGIPVLLVKRDYQTIDSIFLNGSPAPNAMLAPFGLSQGQFGGDNRYVFFRIGTLVPVMQIWFGANNFTTPFQVTVDNSVLSPLGRNEELPTTAWQVFPNPVAGNSVTLQLDMSGSKNWTVQITDLQGRVVQSQRFSGEASLNRYQLNLSPNLTNGLYTCRILDETNGIRSAGKLAVQR